MALLTYQLQTQRLLNDPLATEYSVADLTTYINIGRAQVAADAECIRNFLVINTVVGIEAYYYTNATSTVTSAVSGIAGLLNIHAISRTFGNGGVPLYRRAWPWFDYYYRQQPVRNSGPPTRWSTSQDGYYVINNPLNPVPPNAVFYVDPIPDDTYFLQLYGAMQPIILVNDNTVEVIPYPWTDAVPYYAAYLAYLNSQRPSDADRMFTEYSKFTRRGTQTTTPTQLPMVGQGGAGAKEAAQHTPVTTLPSR